MKQPKKISSAVSVKLLVCVCIITVICVSHPADALAAPSFGFWWYVGGSGPGNFTRIQDAVDFASAGDVVYVYPGVYHENIIIAKQGLTLAGADRYSTTIHSARIAEHTIRIDAPQVVVQGFSIENATGSGAVWDASGVFICASDVVVRETVIAGNQLGLCALNIAFNLTICDNSFLDGGILFGNYLHTPGSPEVPLECFLHQVYNNTVNGKALYYLKDAWDVIVPADVGQVILVNCTNVTIKDISFSSCGFPIALNYCTDCVVEHNLVWDSYGEIMTMRSEHCVFQNNSIDGIIFGVCLDQRSHNNIVRYNTVTNSTGGVVVMIDSSHNLVYENTFEDNLLGIRLFQGAHDNRIYRNSVVRNRIGLYLTEGPYDNAIENNSFLGNRLQVQAFGRTKNLYHHNYWNRPRIAPKIIFGWATLPFLDSGVAVPYCITAVDLNPRSTPV